MKKWILALTLVSPALPSGCGGCDSGGGDGGVAASTEIVEEPFLILRDGGFGDDVGTSLVIEAGGKLLIAGVIRAAAGDQDMAVWRLNADGTLDDSFGAGGRITYDGEYHENDMAHAIALDAEGRIVVAGESRLGDVSRARVWRYLSDGTPDPDFSGGLVTSGGAYRNYAFAVAIDASGRILVAGSRKVDSKATYDLFVWRLTSYGAFDGTFNSDGILAYDGGLDDGGTAIATDNLGRIVVAGATRGSSGTVDIAVWRMDSFGNLDGTFGSGGIAAYPNALDIEESAYGLALEATGGILVAGSTYTGAETKKDAILLKFTAGGVLDPSFGNGSGYVIHHNPAGGDGDDLVFALATDGSGKSLLTGAGWNGSNFDIVLWDFDAAGTLTRTRTFADPAGGNGDDYGFAVRFSATGMAVIAGSSVNGAGNRDLVVLRD